MTERDAADQRLGPHAIGTFRSPARRRDTPVLDLVQRASHGDRDAFASLYRLRFPDVYRFVRSRLHDTTAAEDVVAETFTRAWDKLAGLRKPERFDAWLFQIADNAVTDAFRQRRTTPLEPGQAGPDPRRSASPAALAEAAAVQDDIAQALEQLPSDQRVVLVLRFLRGHSHEETAQQMDRSPEAVRALQYRALRSLRRILTRPDAIAA